VYEKLLQEYDVEPGVLQKDLSDFVQKLVDSGLVKVS
jgi:hypothetical protein